MGSSPLLPSRCPSWRSGSRRTATPATPWWPAIPRPSTSSPTGPTTTTRSDSKLVFPRNKFPKLEQKNIQFWFKNRRAKCKRINNVGNFLNDTPQDPTNLLKIGQNSSTILLHHDRTPPVVTSAPHLHSIINPNIPSSPHQPKPSQSYTTTTDVK